MSLEEPRVVLHDRAIVGYEQDRCNPSLASRTLFQRRVSIIRWKLVNASYS